MFWSSNHLPFFLFLLKWFGYICSKTKKQTKTNKTNKLLATHLSDWMPTKAVCVCVCVCVHARVCACVGICAWTSLPLFFLKDTRLFFCLGMTLPCSPQHSNSKQQSHRYDGYRVFLGLPNMLFNHPTENSVPKSGTAAAALWAGKTLPAPGEPMVHRLYSYSV